MILDTEKWLEENEKNMTEDERHDTQLFMMFGYTERFFGGLCSCCGQWADMELENVEEVDEKTGMMKLSYTCLPCWIKHKEPLTDEEFEKVKEEIPEEVKKTIMDDDRYINRSSDVAADDNDDDDFFNGLCNE